MGVVPHPQTLVETDAPSETDRPVARQEAALVRWLQSQPAVASRPQPPADTAMAQDKVRTLREALAAQGLTLLPDPLERYSVQKVVRVGDLLNRPGT